jgi:hypothetical protein
MKPVNLAGASRAISSSMNNIFSRIVRLDADAEKLLPGLRSPSSIPSGRREESSADIDSCITPSAKSPVRNIDLDRPRDRFLRYRTRADSESSDSHDDYDSCIYPPRDGETEGSKVSFKELHARLLEGSITHFVARPDNGRTVLEVSPVIEPRSVIMSGSFNPLHYGHEDLALRATQEAPRANGKYYFEIGTVNVDKGPVPAEEMEKRVRYINKKGHSCVLTNALFFDAKSDIFPDCIFAIGFDTYTRVINPKSYPEETGGLEGMMSRVEANKCEFFVGGRLDGDGIYTSIGSCPRMSEVALVTGEDVTSENEDDFELIELSPSAPHRGKATCIVAKDGDGNPIPVCTEEPISDIFTGMEGFHHDVSSTNIRASGFTLPELDEEDKSL